MPNCLCSSLGATGELNAVVRVITYCWYYPLASGVVDSIAEVGQQVAWTGAALRFTPANFEPGFYICYPSIVDTDWENNGEDSEPIFEFDFRLENSIEGTSITGRCRYSTFKSLVLVTGFPIRAKPAQTAGLETSLDIMACLAGSHRVVEFDGKVVLKGFSTVLTAVKQTEDLFIWHYTFTPTTAGCLSMGQ